MFFDCGNLRKNGSFQHVVFSHCLDVYHTEILIVSFSLMRLNSLVQSLLWTHSSVEHLTRTSLDRTGDDSLVLGAFQVILSLGPTIIFVAEIEKRQ